MRVLILGVSTLALGACSMGGGGWGHPQGNSYHGVSAPGCHVPVQRCAVTKVKPKPVYRPAPPVYVPPAPAPKVYTPKPCAPAPCSAGSYAVSPYAPAALHAKSHVAHVPDAHAYGSHAPAYGKHSYGGHHGLRGYQPVPKSDFYGTAGLTMYDVDDDVFGLQGRLGYQFHPNLAAEVEGSFGLNSATDEFTALDADDNLVDVRLKTGVDYQLGAFAVAGQPVTEKVRAFGRVGYHETKISLEEEIDDVLVTDVSATTDGIAYGAGLEIAVTPLDAVRADYTRYDTDGGALDSLSLAYLRRF